MATYYNGHFFIKDNFSLIKLKGFFYSLKHDCTGDRVSTPKLKLNIDDTNVLFDFAKKIFYDKGLGKYTLNNLDKKINKLLFDALLIQIIEHKNYHVIEAYNNLKTYNYIYFIYEKVYDKYGRPYAKEMFTGCIFPLVDENDIDFTFSYKICEAFWAGYKLKGNFFPTILNRQNVDRCECFMLESGVANNNDIIIYKETRTIASPDEKIEYLYNMNVFDESVILNNQSQSNFIQNSNSIIDSTKQNNENSSVIKNKSYVSEQLHNIETPKVNLVKPNSIGTKIEILNNIKDFILLLPQEDINLLMDMTNNNFNDPNIFEYLKMPRKEKIKFLDNKDEKTHH